MSQAWGSELDIRHSREKPDVIEHACNIIVDNR